MEPRLALQNAWMQYVPPPYKGALALDLTYLKPNYYFKLNLVLRGKL